MVSFAIPRKPAPIQPATNRAALDACELPPESTYSKSRISTGSFLGEAKRVSLHTEARIRELCAQIVSAKTIEDANQAAAQLRIAIDEHVLQAKDTLKDQADILALLEQVAKRSVSPPLT